MKLNVPHVISPNKKKRLKYKEYDYDIQVIDIASQEVLHHRTDFGGYHTSGTFTEDENIVIYITFDRHWYIPPVISIWDLKNNSVETIHTSQDPGEIYLHTAYHNQHLVLSGSLGFLGAYDLTTKKEIWHHTSLGGRTCSQAVAISKCGEKIALLFESILSVYSFKTGKELQSTALEHVYYTCQFQENDLSIQLKHPEKDPVSICCKNI